AAPANVTITASATDADGSITNVAFFAGNLFLGNLVSSPYSFTWNNAPIGTHALTVRATDDQGCTTTSAVVTITVTANLNPIADPYVRDGSSAALNFGTLTNLEVQTSSTVGNNRDAYFKFDITSINNITNAKLRINAHLTAKATVTTTGYGVADTT